MHHGPELGLMDVKMLVTPYIVFKPKVYLTFPSFVRLLESTFHGTPNENEVSTEEVLVVSSYLVHVPLARGTVICP